MSIAQDRPPLRLTRAETAFVWLRRIAAIYCLIIGIEYWVRLIGVYPGPLWRFDLMPDDWKAATTALAILFPVAATGLWLLAPWGPVIWVAGALVESIIHTVFADTFGYRPLVAVGHGLFLAVYVGLRLTIFWQQHRADQLARTGQI